MLHAIIYEDDNHYMQKNIDCVNKVLMNSDIDYRVYKYETYNEEFRKIIRNKNIKKIYILDIETKDKSGIEIASMIREDDYESIIIFATAFGKYQNDVFYTRLMAIDFICKYKGYEKRLIDDINAAIKILYKEKVFTFYYSRILYRIPIANILYIEKEPIIKRCVIHTINGDFYIMDSIERLITRLGSNFLRTHQSCIVNLDSVKEIDFPSNTILFKNDIKTNLLTNKIKKELKDYEYIN